MLDKNFVAKHARVFEDGKEHSREVTLEDWHRRPLEEKIKGRAMSIFRSQDVTGAGLPNDE